MSDFTTQRPVIFGEVLFDHFPDGSVVLGGAPFNVAWHLQAFGRAPLFISRVGDDPLGRRIRDIMHGWEMDASGLQLDSAHPTGSVEVRIDDELPDGARPDLAVDGTIEIERLTDVLYVGRPVQSQENATVGLYRLEPDGKHAVRVRVELGRASVDVIEIVEGLLEGDRVILSETSRWDDNERIRLR